MYKYQQIENIASLFIQSFKLILVRPLRNGNKEFTVYFKALILE